MREAGRQEVSNEQYGVMKAGREKGRVPVKGNLLGRRRHEGLQKKRRSKG